MEQTISSIGQFIDVIRAVKAIHSGDIWYRGQSNADWQLLPGLLRKKLSVSESSLMSRFKQSAAMLSENRPRNSFDWIFLMQHYGVPTRLLDWSENPLVALYFAVSDPAKNSEGDAAIWLLFPTKLNKNANIVDKNEGDYIPSFDDEEVQGYATESIRQSHRVELFPIATIATRNSPRIQAQMGTFTIHHNKMISIEDVGAKDHVVKVLVPQSNRNSLLEELNILGVNRFSLFPELASVGEVLKELVK